MKYEKRNNIYLKKITLENYGAIEKFDYEAKFDEENNPYPIILIGENGTGKTLLLSNILNSIIEIKRKIYNEILEVEGNKLYKLGSPQYVRKNEYFSYINLEFTDDMHFTNITIKREEGYDFKKLKNYKHVANVDKIIKDRHYTNCTECDLDVFEKNIFLYFPVDRYYIPKWLNENNKKLSFLMTQSYLGKSEVDIVKDNLLEDIETWILDVIVDKYLYDKQIIHSDMNGKTYIEYSGKNSTIQSLINRILSKIFPDCSEYKSARIGISPKGNRTIAIMAKNNNGDDIELVPTFKNLSSGEVMILSMFCSIIKEADRLSKIGLLDLDNISGIVIIDEIDAHLHSNFSKEILPELMSLFPKIQFIVSSHSPFYLLGMKEKYGTKCDFISMPEGIIMEEIENFYEIQKCYEMLDSNHRELVNLLEESKQKILNMENTLIITEGKTDWMHLKNALEFYNNKNEYLNLNLEFLEFKEEFGDSKLENLLIQLSKITNKHKIIGIFDSDDKVGRKYLFKKNFGNNVFGICIPENPKYPNGISIEFLYNDEDLIKQDSNGRRLYLSNEFLHKSRRLISDSSIVTTNNKVECYYKNKIIKVIDDEVYDLNDNNIALSKNDFATNILNKIAPFDVMNLSSFKLLFDQIESIINDN